MICKIIGLRDHSCTIDPSRAKYAQKGNSCHQYYNNDNPRNLNRVLKRLGQMALLAKLPPGGFHLFLKYDVFRQNADYRHEMYHV